MYQDKMSVSVHKKKIKGKNDNNDTDGSVQKYIRPVPPVRALAYINNHSLHAYPRRLYFRFRRHINC